MAGLTVVILAAGGGTRMRSSLPKVLHPLCGRPLVLWPVLAAQAAGADEVVVVEGPGEPLRAALPEGVEVAVQEEQNGTGDAVRAAAGHIADDAEVIVLMGDVPLITAGAIGVLAEAHDTGATVLTMEVDDPAAYGRVVREGNAVRIVEARDATPEQLDLREVNTGIYCFDGGALKEALASIGNDNAQGEFYLPDVLHHMPARAQATDDATVTLGVNDRVDLAQVQQLAQQRIHRHHQRNGVTIVNPSATVIEADVTIGRDTTIEPGTTIKRGTTIGEGAAVRCSYVDRATIEDGVSVGPFAYLRPGAHLKRGAKAGTFVEIKNSVIGEGAKIPHLSYIGDADVGAEANLGAATITANYNPATKVKSRTTMGDRVKTGVDTTLVAPVTLADDAMTGAGSVITDDVGENELAIARARQTNRRRRA